ncbi:MAG: hypothetical protein JST68_14395, partial [Bacteroidetes bacterium]|nr:hypothetical protein [Bacteroidota bacterium]
MAVENENDRSFHQAIELAGIIHKIREKEEVNDEERLLVENWLNQGEANRTLFDSLFQRDRLTGELEVLLTYDTEEAVTAIFAALDQRRPRTVPLWRNVARRGLTAAALLLLLAGGVWYFVDRSNKERAAALTTGNSQPGMDRAVLTLSDSQQIPLDSTRTGSLGLQGGAHVEQLKDRLIYTATGSGAGVL